MSENIDDDEYYDEDDISIDDSNNEKVEENIDEDVILEEEEEDGLLDKIKRIPVKTYIRSQLKVVFGAVIMLFLMLIIISLSKNISGGLDNPPNVLTFTTNSAIYLTIISSALFLLILYIFTRMIFFDKKEEFGIISMKSPRSIWFLLLTISFLAMIYILLDTALINVYLYTGPGYLARYFFNTYTANAFDTSRLAYADIRGLIFTGLLVFNFIFPLFMFLSIFSRYGRGVMKKRKEQEKKPYKLKQFVKLVLAFPLEFAMISLFNATLSIPILPIFILSGTVGLALWIIYQILYLLGKIIKFTIIFSYSNIAMVIPIAFVFYALPALIWAAWDLFTILWYNTLNNTIYEFDFMKARNMVVDPSNISNLDIWGLLQFYLNTALYNAQSLIRILELDVIIILGLAALIIGFAEGYTIFALIKSISKGVSIARTGRIVTRQAPRLVIITTRMLMIFAWMSLLWDKFIGFWKFLLSQFSLNIPDIELPFVFVSIVNFTKIVIGHNEFFAPLTILLIPFYFILTSSFKFLSVSVAVDTERVKDDNQVFLLLISSAFILIVTKIFSDIAELPEFNGVQKPYLPFSVTSVENILPFVLKIAELLETVGFFAGFLVSLFMLIKTFRKNDDD